MMKARTLAATMKGKTRWKFVAMEAEVEHMTETIALASNVKMLMKKPKRKKREIIARLTLATAQTKMMVTMAMVKILVTTTVTMEATVITETVKTMRGNQEMEGKMIILMHRERGNSNNHTTGNCTDFIS
jgi:hypothetical protein